MGFLDQPLPLLLLVIASFFLHSIVGVVDPIVGYNGEEKDALYALKATFDDPFLNQNWTGIHCYMNDSTIWYGIQCVNGRVIRIRLEGMGLITGKTIPANAFAKFTELSILSLRNNSISGNVMDFSSNSKLTSIDLSSNKFYGPISRSLLGLFRLESIKFQDNALTGTIPEFNQLGLREFNVSNNNLRGPIPRTKPLQSFRYNSSYSGNSELCGPPSPTDCSSIESNDTSSNDNKNGVGARFATYFLIVDAVGLLVVILLFILYYKKVQKLRKYMNEKSVGKFQKEEEEEEEEEEGEGKGEEEEIKVENKTVEPAADEKEKLVFMSDEVKFELGDLLKSSAEGLGKGSFGNSYKVMLNDGLPAVVVKRLRDLKPMTSEEFAKQLRFIADLKHPNLMPVLAYYYAKDEKLVVYKYAEKGNLFDRIHGRRGTKDRIPFTWSSRLSVARGVAQALEYLHLNMTKSSQNTVPHGNLKSTNVLLGENETVLVSDYALTSIISLPIAAQRMVSYKSPEFQTTRKISKKSDVWNFGTLLLELLTGRISACSAPAGTNGVDLCSWVHRAVREEWTAEIFDPEISVQRSATQGMFKLLQVAIRCCDKSPEKRPVMAEVARDVRNLKVVVESDDDDDDSLSFDRSSTDDSLTITGPSIVRDRK